MPHAETLLFVDDDEPEVVEADVGREDGVSPYHDVAYAGFKPLERSPARLGRLEARDGLYPDWRSVEARGERLEMLFGEDCRRGEDGDLLAVHRRHERGAHCDFRLAVACVSADEPVHWLCRGKVFVYRLDGGLLVGRLFVGKRGIERVAPVAMDVVGEARDGVAFGLRLEKRRREVCHGLCRGFLVLLPALAVEPVHLDGLALDTYVSGEQMGVRGGNVELAAVGVFNSEHLAAATVNGNLRRAYVSSYAVIDVNYVFAGLKVVEVVDPLSLHRLRNRSCTRLALREHPVGLCHDDKRVAAVCGSFACERLKAAGEPVDCSDRVAALPCSFHVAFKALPGLVEKLGMVRLLRTKLGEAWKGRCLEAMRGYAFRGGVARKDGKHPGTRLRKAIWRIFVVLDCDYAGAFGKGVEYRGRVAAFAAFAACACNRENLVGIRALYRNLRGGVERA